MSDASAPIQFLTGAACYLLCGTGHLMPGTVVEYDGKGLCAVKSPGGKIYSCSPVNVLDPETGRIMLMHSRAETMAQEGYEIKVRLDRTFRIFQLRKHGPAGGYIVRFTDESLTCTCPAHDKSCTCKHVMAVCSLLLKRSDRLREAGKTSVATRYINLARAITLAA
jgi:hypothetical protein